MAFGLWAAGSLVHLAFTFAILSSWMHHTHYDIKHANPAWFIPVVGNLFVPICGVLFAPAELSWFFFSIGVVFWIVLMTIVFYRVFFHEPIPARLQPTLFILLAPPAVGFIAYGPLVPQLDGFGRVLYYTALFLTLLRWAASCASSVAAFLSRPGPIPSPLAAMTIASIRHGEAFGAGLLSLDRRCPARAIVSLVVGSC